MALFDLEKILDRLAMAMEAESGETPYEKDIAAALGLSPTNLSNMKKRGAVPFEEISLFAAKRKISINWILFGQSPRMIDEAMEDVYKIHLLSKYTVSGGGGAVNEETEGDEEEWLVLDRKSAEAIGISDMGRIEAVRVVGDSMEPTIPEGSLVLIDRGRNTISDGGIYAVNVAGMVFVKRVRFDTKGRVELISENPAYPPSIENPEEVMVIGRIVGTLARV